MKLSLRFASAMTVVLIAAVAPAQTVIFPQQQQPGEARLIENGSGYTLANDLIEASFDL